MLWYIARRVGYALIVVWAAWTVTFILLYRLPSDPVSIMLHGAGGEVASRASATQRAALAHQYGFDRPVIVQYFLLLGRALRGDFGLSVQNHLPVAKLVGQALPSTVQIALLGLAFALLLGAGVAIAANYSRNRFLRGLLFAVPPLTASFPTFWVGLMLLEVFSFRLGWFPAVGNDGFRAAVLPAITLAIPAAASYAQVLSRGIEKTLREPFIDVVRAKGAQRARVHLVHAFRNAMIPALTLVGLTVGGIFAGAVVTETVFSRSGMGNLLQASVNSQDIPVVQILVLLSAVAFAIVNLAVDLVYPFIDPRIARPAR